MLQWFENNSLLVIGVLFALYILAFNKLPSIASWQSFLDSFESKGGQLMLLFVMDLIVLTVLVRFWKGFDAQLQTTIVGLLSGVNGAFLGAIGARNTSANGIGGGAVGPLPAADVPPAQPPRPAPAAPSPVGITPVTLGGTPGTSVSGAKIGEVGAHGHVGDLGTNQPSTAAKV